MEFESNIVSRGGIAKNVVGKSETKVTVGHRNSNLVHIVPSSYSTINVFRLNLGLNKLS